MQPGYYRYPTIHDDTLVFVSEDDLWSVPAGGGVARRLTTGPGAASRPRLSPDGSRIAFTSNDEGHSEVYGMPAGGGTPRRLSFLGANTLVAAWRPDGEAVICCSSYQQPFERQMALFEVPAAGGHPSRVPCGPARTIAHGPGGRTVIGRHTDEIAYWKRYRGGRTGVLWIDAEGDGRYRPLIDLRGNLASPLWTGERIYFLSDHEGLGNLYSCTPEGEDLRRHTDHERHYARNPDSDGRRIVYHAGAELYCLDPAEDRPRRIEVLTASPRPERARKFVPADRYLEQYQLHPAGHTTLAVCRGKAFAMGHWEGAVRRYGAAHGVRYRCASFLGDGRRVLVVSDAGEREALEIHDASPPHEVLRLEGADLGRTTELAASPSGAKAALANHRHELLLVDLADGSARTIDHSPHHRLAGLAWSPDGNWLAYSIATTQQTFSIKLYDTARDTAHRITPPEFRDVAPDWDPEGKYLYFLSYRVFDPVYDNQFFELSFPRGMLPYLVTLQADTPSPFVPEPRAPGGRPRNNNGEPENAGKEGKRKPETPPSIRIDLEGIERRIVPFPVREGRFGRIRGLPGKALYSRFPIDGSLRAPDWRSSQVPARGQLECFSYDKQEQETLLGSLTDFELSADRKTLIYRSGRKLRVLRAGEKPGNKERVVRPGRDNGWLDLQRIKLEVDPPLEWRQMFAEAWRLQREQFWVEDMSRVDWRIVRERYEPLLERVATRRELSDLLWEMQGELGTSHCYEMGGDLTPPRRYRQGHLGLDLELDAARGLYRIARVLRGDPWKPEACSPLLRPGTGVAAGQTLLAVGGRAVGPRLSPLELLVNLAGEEVELTVGDANGANPRNVTVRTLKSETEARYREWVDRNRQAVLDATGDRAGYIHIPNMGPQGYSEFHRAWLSQLDRQALVVDVRCNGGGHVSSLILEKLARRRIGYDLQRWGQPMSYPPDSVSGPLVALTDENAGSDGDIFSHCFKLMHLGPLVGKRTWGGVIGIWPRHRLVDGTITTQPEFSFWFTDVGWDVENHGTEPDIEVELAPQDHAAGRDTQLERATSEMLRLLEGAGPALPDFPARPDLSLPELPPRPR